MSKALIVGYGFTGWSIDSALRERGFDVYGLRRDWNGPSKNTYSAEKVTGDITDPESLRDLSIDPDLVVNCVSAGDRGNTDRYRQVYLQGGRHLMDWCVERGVSRVIYTSSSAVYGDRDGDRVDETDSPDPASPSAEVLVEAENQYHQFREQDDLEAIVCRLTGIYGPGRQRVIRRFLGGKTTLRGGGGRYRNMVRREDVGAMIATLATEDPKYDCYNLTDCEPVTELEFFRWLSDRMDRPMPEVTEDSLKRSNKQVSNQRFIEEFGNPLRFPNFREGYEPLIESARASL